MEGLHRSSLPRQGITPSRYPIEKSSIPAGRPRRPAGVQTDVTLHPSKDIGVPYTDIRRCARRIAARFPVPEFYVDFPLEFAFSQRFFELDPTVCAIRRIAVRELEDDLGHGLPHADKVSLDAGALAIIESRRIGLSLRCIRKRLRLAQSAGLLHDIRRKDADHALTGSIHARKLLEGSGLFTSSEIDAVCGAILNHEAFKRNLPIPGGKDRMISDCLYDADKFRWGYDNFTDTVWTMVSYLRVPIEDFIGRYPQGMARIADIKRTFRTETGKVYGPRFIDMGLAVGRLLYETLRRDFAAVIAP
ncbi:metal dependent phosphohydrolase [Desulfococcus multivorans DSM 2059]|uniref:Metal dependent phosphohydrolase n=1 Tax=Desulfococcus multivorans DSM 2059 TaxID=1121405 RepID=S7TRA4_DESML|nr:metal dependent phosphohydrolase [Desulfococcus multivorans DSM 2059]SJZ57418.1 hypothetical protein SAMN02745446_00967 [Desulfococcus multivorans DSM 2059]